MSICAGLVGLPNVGKSTLFNALTKSSIPAENYPFCTIDPHLAYTFVPDERIKQLKDIYSSKETLPSTVQFVDIAGLVKGASKGQGLGNQFLNHIREVDLVLHVLRCFEDKNITKENPVEPVSDFDTIVTELILKDIESIEKRKAKITQLTKSAKNKPKELKELQLEQELLDSIHKALDNNNISKAKEVINESKIETIPLLSTKKFLILANISEQEIENDEYKNNKFYKELVNKFGKDIVIPISAKLEHEISTLSKDDAKEVAEMMGLKKSGLNNIIKKTFDHLNLITFFTCGPKEIHAWPIPKGINIRKASREIHSDLQRGFICADVFNAKDLMEAKSLLKLKESGSIKTVGQEYIVEDGDIINVKFNV